MNKRRREKKAGKEDRNETKRGGKLFLDNNIQGKYCLISFQWRLSIVFAMCLFFLNTIFRLFSQVPEKE